MKTEQQGLKATVQQTAAVLPTPSVENPPRRPYLPPTLEIIEMQNEGVIAASGNVSSPGLGGGTNLSRTTGDFNSYNSATTGDLEDLINDILTVEQ